ncbi:MAG: hypothetical protein IJX46_03630, partial [Clostridia bacterium]|nr:hypothetical protein [Clostridia bacterium]
SYSFLPRFGAFSFVFLDLANLHSKRLSQSPSKKLLTQLLIQAAGLAYHHDAVVYIISPFGAVSHHAIACILPAA